MRKHVEIEKNNNKAHETLEKIVSKLKEFKLRKYELWQWWDKEMEHFISETRITALGWTHGDEAWAFQWFSEISSIWSSIECILINPFATEKWIRFIDDDINRTTARWYEYERKKQLLEGVKGMPHIPYFLDFHNCHGKIKMWCVSNTSKKHILMAHALWLDTLIVWDKKIAEWTIVHDMSSLSKGDGMVVEIGTDLDNNWKTSIFLAKKLIEVDGRISIIRENMNEHSEFITLEDLAELLWIDIHKKIPVLHVDLLVDEDGQPIQNQEKIPKNIPEHCCQWSWQNYIVIKNQDGTFPEKALVEKTIWNM